MIDFISIVPETSRAFKKAVDSIPKALSGIRYSDKTGKNFVEISRQINTVNKEVLPNDYYISLAQNGQIKTMALVQTGMFGKIKGKPAVMVLTPDKEMVSAGSQAPLLEALNKIINPKGYDRLNLIS